MTDHPTMEQIRAMRDNPIEPDAPPPMPITEPLPSTPTSAPVPSTAEAPTPRPALTNVDTAVLDSRQAQELRARWLEVQGMFVDEPRSAVQQADALVAQVLDQVEQLFAQEKAALEREWTTGESVETETLRLALRRYRAFFDRLLAL